MNFLARLFRKPVKSDIPPMPTWETIVEMMYDRQLDTFADEVIQVIYSKDRSMRYVIFKNENNLFSYQLEAICQFDAEEWKYLCSNDPILPAMWEPFHGIVGNSFFEHKDDLIREMKAEPEYKQFFP